MENLTPEIIQPLGVAAILGVLVFFLLNWIKALVENNREDSKKSVEVMEGVKNALENNTEVMNRVLDRFDDTMRNSRKDSTNNT